jgi:large repetitive protein
MATSLAARISSSPAVTFAGAAGQVVTVNLTGNTVSTLAVTLRKPDGTTLTSTTLFSASGSLSQVKLPAAGTYTVYLNPSTAMAGQVAVAVS